jgi:hypothetical protein
MLNLKTFRSKINTPCGLKIKLDTSSNSIQENSFKLSTSLIQNVYEDTSKPKHTIANKGNMKAL